MNNWIVEPNEALDIIFFINAISDDDFYNNHYQDVRARWLDRIGDHGRQLIHQVRKHVAMSRLAVFLNQLNVSTLEDIISFFTNYGECRTKLMDKFQSDIDFTPYAGSLDAISKHLRLFQDCFQMLEHNELHIRWRQHVRPHILNVTEPYTRILTRLFALDNIQSAISHFLGNASSYTSYSIYMCTYIKPISVQLSKNAMATHQGPPGYMPLPNQIVSISVHESLHGFTGSYEAQDEQMKLLKISPSFSLKYEELLTKWQSGPEEFFVVGAEAYLTELLNLRTYEQCIHYLNTQNGGMPLSKSIYHALRETRPETKSDWKGYGSWLVSALKNNEIHCD